MCEPMTIAVTAAILLSATSAALTIQGQRQQAATQEEYQERLANANREQMARNRELATESFLAQTAQEYKRLSETREATAMATHDKSLEADRARDSVLASAAESGVDGVSLTGLLNDFHRQEATFGLRYATNLEYREAQTDFNVSSLRSQAAARIASIAPYQPAPIQGVNYAGPIIQAAQQGLSSWTTKMAYDRLGTPPTKTDIDSKPLYADGY